MAVDANRRRLSVGVKQSGDAEMQAALNLPLSGALEDKTLVVVHSKTDAVKQSKPSFAEKDREGSWEHEALAGVKCVCKKGLKPEAPNQDSYVVVVKPGKWGLYGVLDGHGPNGHNISDFALHSVTKLFLENAALNSETGKAFTTALIDCQQDIRDRIPQAQHASSGSTCTLAFHNFETDVLTLAHVGDCRAVLYEGVEVPLTVVKETEDHKPNLPAEQARITQKGGRVVFDGYYNYRVFSKKGMYPGLNMSRALGDVVGHDEAGLTAEPELNVVNVQALRAEPGPLNLVIASDGCWEFIASEEAPTYLAEKGSVTSDVAGVERLAQKSYDLWLQDSGGEISDDITVMQVTL